MHLHTEYVWICLHIPEKAEFWIWQNNECVWCSIVKDLRWRVLQKEEILRVGEQPDIFQCRGRFMELGHFDKHFAKNTSKKKTLFSKAYWEFFLLDTLKFTTMDIIFWDFSCISKFFFHHKWNEASLLVINMVDMNYELPNNLRLGIFGN